MHDPSASFSAELERLRATASRQPDPSAPIKSRLLALLAQYRLKLPAQFFQESLLESFSCSGCATDVSRGQNYESQPRWHPQRHLGKAKGPLDRDGRTTNARRAKTTQTNGKLRAGTRQGLPIDAAGTSKVSPSQAGAAPHCSNVGGF